MATANIPGFSLELSDEELEAYLEEGARRAGYQGNASGREQAISDFLQEITLRWVSEVEGRKALEDRRTYWRGKSKKTPPGQNK